jgi:hypothetical protein
MRRSREENDERGEQEEASKQARGNEWLIV